MENKTTFKYGISAKTSVIHKYCNKIYPTRVITTT